jgi:hypothetical protein
VFLFFFAFLHPSSGRTEKQAQRDAQLRLRSPPQFTRTPSRRYQRRIVEGAQDSKLQFQAFKFILASTSYLSHARERKNIDRRHCW